ncbi:MAG: hypothetical protein K2I70_05955, partial [Bacilli bacterium]|nr:hypothetical protein [Bacilli bacterium]
IMTFTFIAIASATSYSSVAIILTKKGDYQEKVNSLKKGNDKLTVEGFSKNDATLGLSLSKKGVFGYSFISRCNISIANKTSVSCTWKNQKAGTYKGTVVLDSIGSNYSGSVDGYMYLSDEV